jgi:hypothetical protein
MTTTRDSGVLLSPVFCRFSTKMMEFSTSQLPVLGWCRYRYPGERKGNVTFAESFRDYHFRAFIVSS